MDSMIELFFLEHDFAADSDGAMTQLYEIAGHGRYDWIWVECALKRGIEVRIWPATDDEIAWAFKKLEKLKEQRAPKTCESCKVQ